jgi:hypothetical protein
MAYRKISLLKELKRMSRGKEPTCPVELVAEWALPLVEAELENNELNELFRLFRLEDPRG